MTMFDTTSTPTRPIPWTLVDGILTLRLSDSVLSLTEDHPNYERILTYLRQTNFHVVETLVYRQDSFQSLEERLQNFSLKAESDRDLVADMPKAEGSLPMLYVAPQEIIPATGRVSTVIIDPINDREDVLKKLFVLALQTNRDAFAYQSSEEKFSGDLKVSPSGLTFEYHIRGENWVPICQIKFTA